MKALNKLGLFSAAAALALVCQSASANTTTSGHAFHNWVAGENQHFDYVLTGVRNMDSIWARNAVASIGFHPPAGWAGGNVLFYVDGKNAPGTSTSHSLYAHNFNGVVQSSQFFNSNAATYDTPLTLTGLSVYSYVMGLATLPPNTGSVVFGVVAIQ